MSARWALIALTLLLAACARAPKKSPAPPAVAASNASPIATPLGEAGGDDPCAVIYEHNEADYTPGGLYRPGQRDSGPARAPDLGRIPEPVPRAEPRARYGNRSPYTVLGKSYRVMEDSRGHVERGIASWYGQKFHGRPTSSLEPYDMCRFTAAHKTLPLPSYVRVTNLENGRSVIVRVNDRGPFHDGRIIDLSYVAALKLGVHAKGTAPVEVRAIDPEDPLAGAPPVETRPARAQQRALRERATRSATAAIAPRWLQVGSFGERDNARRLVARLESAGIGPVEMRAADVDGRRVWRVRIGPLHDAAQAEALSIQLRGMGMGSPRLLSE